MTPTIELICGHRSIRHFTDEPISEAQREAIINSARATSSSSFLQCSSIIRITDKALREELVTLTGGQKHVAQAAEFWVFCADFNRHLQICPDAQLGLAEQLLLGVVDTAMMAQNALIAAESLGLGGVYIGGLRNNIEAVTKLLKLPQHVLPLFGLCLGWPADNPDLKPRLPASILVLDSPGLVHPLKVDADASVVDNVPVHVALRPEKIMLCEEPPANGCNFAVGEVIHIAYLGDLSVYHVRLKSGQMISAQLQNAHRHRKGLPTWGDEVRLCWEVDSCVVLTV